MTLQSAIEEFLIDQQVRGNSPKTLRYYRQTLRFFTEYTGSIPVSEVTLSVCKRYFLHLSQKNVTTTTVQTYIRGLRAFLAWCYAEGYISENIPARFKLPKAQRKTVDVLTDDEIQRLFSCFNLRTLIGARDFAICALMLDSGLRLNEVVTLERDGVHVAEGYAIVNGKGNKQRIVPLGLQSRRALIRYMGRAPKCSIATCLVENDQLIPLSQHAVASLFRRLKKIANIPRLHPHLLRHSFATRYLDNGGDIYSLQQILGHTSLEMVKRYVHLIPSKTIICHAQYSPLDTLAKKARKP